MGESEGLFLVRDAPLLYVCTVLEWTDQTDMRRSDSDIGQKWLCRGQIKRTNVRTEVFGAFATSSSLLNQVEELRLLRFLLNPAMLTLPLTGC